MTPPAMTDDQSERPGDNLWGGREVPHHEPLTPPHDSDPGEQEIIHDSPPPEVQPQNGQHVTSPIVQKMQNSYDQAADQPLDFSLKREPAGCIFDQSNDSDERESNSSHSATGDSRPESRASSGTPSPGEISREPLSVRTLGEGADLSDSHRGVACLNRSLSWVSRHAGHNGIPEVAYPNDSLSLPLGYICIPGYGDAGHSVGSDKQYKQYRAQLLKSRQDIGKKRNKKSLPEGELPPITDAVNAASLPSGIHGNKSEQPLSPGGSVASRSALVNPISSVSGRGVRRASKILSEDQKDDLYWERRRKNNEAAKRSRDARRAKEDEIAIKAALLEQENLRLKVEVAGLKNEINKLRYMLVNN